MRNDTFFYDMKRTIVIWSGREPDPLILKIRQVFPQIESGFTPRKSPSHTNTKTSNISQSKHDYKKRWEKPVGFMYIFFRLLERK